MTIIQRLLVFVIGVFSCAAIRAEDLEKRDLSKNDYSSSNSFANCILVSVIGNDITVSYKQDGYLKHNTFTMANVLVNGTLIKSCRDYNSYGPMDLMVGDIIEICTTADELAVAISLRRRPNGIVPPGRKNTNTARPYNERINLLNKLTDGGVLSEVEARRFGITSESLFDAGHRDLAARLYDNGKLKPVEDQVPKPKANTDDKTLKAPSATAPKDKPPTDKK